MYQIQGKCLWGGEGWAGLYPDGSIAEGGLTTTAVLGAIAVAISAINIAGGFAVTFRMLVRNHCPPPQPACLSNGPLPQAMFSSSDDVAAP